MFLSIPIVFLVNRFRIVVHSVCNWEGTDCLSWKERYHLRVWTVFKVINSGHIYCHIKLLRCLKRWNVISISCFKSFDISLRSFEVTSRWRVSKMKLIRLLSNYSSSLLFEHQFLFLAFKIQNLMIYQLLSDILFSLWCVSYFLSMLR